MSDSMIVFVKKSKLPNVNKLRDEVKSMGLELEEWGESLEEIEGFWPGKVDGKEAGFEFFMEEIADEDLEDWEIKREELKERDFFIELAFYEELDIKACVIFVVALCILADAIALDEEGELSIDAKSCLKWAKEEMGYSL